MQPELMDKEAPAIDAQSLSVLARAEIDMQISTARAYPRSNTEFLREATELVTHNEDMASACIYALPRGKDGKTIAGPSARFAEIIQHCFGNNRGGARVVDISKEFVTAQGVYHDLEKNVQVSMEVQRRITDKYGKRFNADMIGVTGNAAASIAHRNAVLKGIPKALWMRVYDAARSVAVGDITTLSARRESALATFQKMGVAPPMIFAKLGIEGAADIGLEHLEYLTGLRTAIKEGLSIEEAFAPETESKVGAPLERGKVEDLAAKLAERGKSKKDKPVSVDPDTGEVLPPELQSKE